MVANGDTESAVQLMLLKDESNNEEVKENYHGILDLSPKVVSQSFYLLTCMVVRKV